LITLALFCPHLASAGATPLPGQEACQKLTQNYQDALKARNYVSASKIGQTLKHAGCGATPEPTFSGPSGCLQGIKNIAAFLQVCPTADLAYPTIARDLSIRFDGNAVDSSALSKDVNQVCAYMKSPSGSAPSLRQDTEYSVLQALRTIYHMNNQVTQGVNGCAYPYPWTGNGSLYGWIVQNIGGVDIRDDITEADCCDSYNGRLFIDFTVETADNVANDRLLPWATVAVRITGIAHETRHAQGSAYNHTTCAPNPPCPSQDGGTNPSCDASYNEANLSPYGIQYWLLRAWVNGIVTVGDQCLPGDQAQQTASLFVQSANSYADTSNGNFCSNPPPVIAVPTRAPGPCPP
jgi:hypothetical protein